MCDSLGGVGGGGQTHRAFVLPVSFARTAVRVVRVRGNDDRFCWCCSCSCRRRRRHEGHSCPRFENDAVREV